MKELKLLAEDWKPEIDYSKADVIVSKIGMYVKWFTEDGFFVSRSGSRETLASIIKLDAIKEAYKRENDELVRLKPEPRPADSIKLSECDPEKHMVMLNYIVSGEVVRCRASFEDMPQHHHAEWVVRNLDGSLECHGDLVRICRNFKSIEIYDMSA